jgi:ATP-binding cassette subfamily F protein 3
MITLSNLTMGFTQRTLFKDVSLSIFPNEKIGLTGPNGAGKTTLFSIILGEMEPVAGLVQLQKNIAIGHLPQESKFASSRTVMEEILEGDARIRKLMEEKHQLEENNKADSSRYGDVLEELEKLGIYEIEHKAEKILSGLGFKEFEFHKPLLQLSGGWQMRALLAKLLTYSYDLLLLDEPTNHLDLNATLWLKDFLSSYPGAFVLISHDRVFLNDVTNYTIVLEGRQMTKLKGNYETYEMQKDIQYKTLEKQQKVVEKKRDQLERFAQRFHAQPNKASAVRNKKKMLERLEEIELPQEHRSIGTFQFEGLKPSGYVVATVKALSKSYKDKTVYKNLDFEVIRGQKICFVGPNGAGKSTLLKMLAGAIEPDSGTIQYGHQVEKGYYSQARMDILSAERTAYDEVMLSAPPGTQAVKIRTLLGLFNYHGDDVFKLVKVLSGGEKSRLILAKLLINPPNFMLLDEPTTHLDMDGVKALTTAFKEYTGTMCFISHDLYFIKEIADHIVEVVDGQIKIYSGGLDYYLDKKQGNASHPGGGAAAFAQHQNQASKKEKKENDKDKGSTVDNLQEQHKQALKRIDQIKNEIKKIEREKQELETESYVKGRMLTTFYENRDGEKIKEYGQRLKYIQSRLREIESTIKQLREEREKMSK